jgi:hypothetical protein
VKEPACKRCLVTANKRKLCGTHRLFHVGSNNPKLHALGAKRDSLVVGLPGGLNVPKMDIHLNKHHVKLRKVGKHFHSLQNEAALGFMVTYKQR